MSVSHNLIPVTLLTGFLGSGKTTLLNRLLDHSAMAGTAVVVNEFGEIGLDDLLIERAARAPVLLKNGCICCSVRGDLALALQDVILSRGRGDADIRRVVIETSGVSDPSPILHTLMTDAGIASHFRLNGVVTVIDGLRGIEGLDREPIAEKQAAIADRLVLSKLDLVAGDEISKIGEILARRYPAAVQLRASETSIDPSAIMSLGFLDTAKEVQFARWLPNEAPPAAHHHHCKGKSCDHPSHENAHSDIATFHLGRGCPVSWEALSAWLEALIADNRGHLLRLKGIVDVSDCPGEPIVIHGVEHVFHPPVRLECWPRGEQQTRIVLIGRKLDRMAIEHDFRALK